MTKTYWLVQDKHPCFEDAWSVVGDAFFSEEHDATEYMERLRGYYPGNLYRLMTVEVPLD